jgi:hypothetical protein
MLIKELVSIYMESNLIAIHRHHLLRLISRYPDVIDVRQLVSTLPSDWSLSFLQTLLKSNLNFLRRLRIQTQFTVSLTKSKQLQVGM